MLVRQNIPLITVIVNNILTLLIYSLCEAEGSENFTACARHEAKLEPCSTGVSPVGARCHVFRTWASLWVLAQHPNIPVDVSDDSAHNFPLTNGIAWLSCEYRKMHIHEKVTWRYWLNDLWAEIVWVLKDGKKFVDIFSIYKIWLNRTEYCNACTLQYRS
jgi:hypothetical protein